MLEDYGFLGHQLLDIMGRVLAATVLDEAWREAESILLARVVCDLRTVLMVAEVGYPLQALTLASSLIEHAHVLAILGTDNDLAKKWAEYDNDYRPFPGYKQRKLFTEALRAPGGRSRLRRSMTRSDGWKVSAGGSALGNTGCRRYNEPRISRRSTVRERFAAGQSRGRL